GNNPDSPSGLRRPWGKEAKGGETGFLWGAGQIIIPCPSHSGCALPAPVPVAARATHHRGAGNGQRPGRPARTWRASGTARRATTLADRGTGRGATHHDRETASGPGTAAGQESIVPAGRVRRRPRR